MPYTLERHLFVEALDRQLRPYDVWTTSVYYLPQSQNFRVRVVVLPRTGGPHHDIDVPPAASDAAKLILTTLKLRGCLSTSRPNA